MSGDLAFVLEGHAASNEESGKYDVAEALYRRALVIQEGKPTPDKALAALLNNLALLLWKTGKSSEGERLSLRSIGIFEELLGHGHPLVADCLFDLASHYEAQGRYQKAERSYRRAVAIQETRLPGMQISSERRVIVPSEYLTLAQSLLALARVLERLSKHGEAEQIRARIHYTAGNEPFAGVRGGIRASGVGGCAAGWSGLGAGSIGERVCVGWIARAIEKMVAVLEIDEDGWPRHTSSYSVSAARNGAITRPSTDPSRIAKRSFA